MFQNRPPYDAGNVTAGDLIEINLSIDENDRLTAETEDLSSTGRHPAWVMNGIRHQAIDLQLQEDTE